MRSWARLSLWSLSANILNNKKQPRNRSPVGIARSSGGKDKDTRRGEGGVAAGGSPTKNASSRQEVRMQTKDLPG